QLHLAAPTPENGAVEAPRALRELRREACLAHPRIAAERDEAAVTAASREESVLEDEQLFVATDERRPENPFHHGPIVPLAAIRSGAAPVDPPQIRAVSGEEVAERVAAELLARRASELPRDTRLGNDGERFDGGRVAPLDERLRRLARLEVDRRERLHQR